MGTASDSTYCINYTVQWSLISGHSPWVDYKTRMWRSPWVDWWKEGEKTGHDPSRMWALRTSPYVAGPYVAGPYVAVTRIQVCCAISHLPRYLMIPGWKIVWSSSPGFLLTITVKFSTTVNLMCRWLLLTELQAHPFPFVVYRVR